MKKLVLLFLTSIILTVLAACGGDSSENAEGKVLKVGTTAKSYPNAYEEDGELIGFDVEVLETIAENLGYEVEWTKKDFAELMGNLETGKIDTIANIVAVNEERTDKYHFSDPYAFDGTTIVTHEENAYTSLDQLNMKEVSGVSESNSIKNLENYDPEIFPRTYETRDAAMEDAINKRVDGYVSSKSALIADIELNELPLKFVGDPFAYEDIAFPFVKDEDGKALRDEFNAELEKLRGDGTLTDISEKYFSGEDITTKE